MSDGLEQAASAFAAQIDPSSKPASAAKGAPERLVSNREMEEDENFNGEFEPESLSDGVDHGSLSDAELEKFLDNDDDAKEESDDNSSDEDDEESDKDDEEADDEDPASKEFLSQLVEVTVDGEVQQVSMKEALQGYIRTKTFHKRMNEVANLKSAVTAQAREIVTDRQKSIMALNQAVEEINSLIPPEPDWDKLFEEDPKRAREVQRNFQAIVDKRNQLAHQRNEMVNQQRQDDARSTQIYAEQELDKFLASDPKLRDTKFRDNEFKSMVKTGRSAGFSDQELSTVYDSRMLTILRKASKYDRMMANKPKPVAKPTPNARIATTGTAPRKAVPSGKSQAVKRLSRTGSLEDAAAVFQKLIT